jgi:chromosomal replication initiator protein
MAHAAAMAVAREPGRAYNPLFLYGSVGLGKTHLLQAICHTVTAAAPDCRCFYLSCETFANDYMEAFEQGAMHRFRQRYREADLLVIDDIQFLSARERSQEEFFHTFNTLVQAGKQIVLSADCSPGDLPQLEQRLISRFHSGLVSVLDRPCLETRIAIVRRKATMRCIEVGDEVIHLVASRIDGNVRELEGALTRLDAMSHTEEQPITMELARRAIGEGPVRTPPIAAIMEVVAGRMEVSIADLQSKKRAKSVTLPRHVCMYVTREVTNRSFEEIGGFFGGRDHTTVLHAHRTIAERLGNDEQLRSIVHDIVEDVRRVTR